MTKTVTLPLLDPGNLSPLVTEAIAQGAVPKLHPHDDAKMTLTFAKASDAAAFEKTFNTALAAIVRGDDIQEVEAQPDE